MELQQLQLEIVISEDTERETQRQSLKVRMQHSMLAGIMGSVLGVVQELLPEHGDRWVFDIAAWAAEQQQQARNLGAGESSTGAGLDVLLFAADAMRLLLHTCRECSWQC
jgi:hypothetical protein